MNQKQLNYLNSQQMEFSTDKDQKPIYIKTLEYSSIQNIWSEYSNYKQTSAGLNHFRRDVIIADFDAPIEKFNEVFNNSGLPKFSYVLVNKTSGHVQAGYILRTPFLWTSYNTKEKEIYLTCKRNLNSFCPDNGYKGWRCKNPYFEEFETTWNNITYDKDLIKEILMDIKSNNTFYKKINKNDNKTEKRKNKTQTEGPSGRNNFYLYKVTVFYSKCKTENIRLTLQELEMWLFENEDNFRAELLDLNPDIENAPLPEKEIFSICNSAKKYVDINYQRSKAGGYSKQQRENSLEIRQLESERKFIDFCDYMDSRVEFREILEILGIKKTTGYEYRKLYFELLENRSYYYFRDSKGYSLNPFNMVHENQLLYPYVFFPEF